MQTQTAIDRVRALFKNSETNQQAYEPIDGISNDEDVRRPILVLPEDDDDEEEEGPPFLWFEYCVFLMLGIAMLWAWNMFLAAAPYFQARFQDDPKILSSFQSSIISVGCVTNLGSMLLLSKMHAKASYQKRIISSLVINTLVFALLAISTKYFRGISSAGYLTFTLLMVFTTSVATGLCQNGAFAFASSFKRREYTQAIMLGQAVAGVLPSMAQIGSVLALPATDNWAEPDSHVTSLAAQTTTSALVYFSTATGISIITLLAVFPLIRRHNRILERELRKSAATVEAVEQAKRKPIGMWELYKKLHWLAISVFLCFTVTMFFPVFTQKIVSIVPEDKAPRLFQPATFIPLGFLVWNLGDFTGRLLTSLPFFQVHHPVVLFVVSLLRIGFLPLYLLCNIEGRGALVNSDSFYLFFVQLGFGSTNGWLSSLCMMDAADWVEEGEGEAAAGFMAVNLVGGLTVGSLLSFAAANVS